MILLAGATGVLGAEVAKRLEASQIPFRCLVRRPSSGAVNQAAGDLLQPESLKRAMDGVDAVISCAGASMKLGGIGDRASFYKVDAQGNQNLLNAARAANAKKFVYVSLASADKLRHTEYSDAHEKFVESLKRSSMDSTVVRPTGFFRFNLEILKMAKNGRVAIVGDGSARTNPIHEADVAAACVEALQSGSKELPVGGPEVFSRRRVVEMAFEAVGRTPKVMQLGRGLIGTMIAPMRLLNPRLHALMYFGQEVSLVDVIAPAYGQQRLGDYFRDKMISA